MHTTYRLRILVPFLALAALAAGLAVLSHDTPPAAADQHERASRIGTEAHNPQFWGDNDCDGSIDPRDSLFILRHDAGLILLPSTGVAVCPSLGTNVLAAGFGRLWGDNDCSGSVNPIDSLKTLRFDAGLSTSKVDPTCPDAGSVNLG